MKITLSLLPLPSFNNTVKRPAVAKSIPWKLNTNKKIIPTNSTLLNIASLAWDMPIHTITNIKHSFALASLGINSSIKDFA